MAYGYTTNFNFEKPDFNETAWHDNFYKMLDELDAALFAAYYFENFKGLWQNSTAYAVGDRAVDVADGILYECAVGHTSHATDDFSTDRTNNPTYWTVFTNSVLAEKWATQMGSAVSGTGWSARAWADTAEDTQLETGDYSAKHHAAKAAASAAAAAASAVPALATVHAYTIVRSYD